MTGMLDYKLVEALAAVIDEGGFEKAAVHLHLTQSAVSQRVKLLEEQAGQVLLVRSSPPEPTRAGRLMVKHYRQVSRLEGDLHDTLFKHRADEYERLSVGVNADSLVTWFPAAVSGFLHRHRVALDLQVDDQGQTHRLLHDGEVAGCVSAEGRAVQGCRVDFLGAMEYRLLTTPDFADRHFASGFTLKAAKHAPAVIYNRKDELHHRMLRVRFGRSQTDFPRHYVPGAEAFMEFIAQGAGYGMLPVLQAEKLLADGRLVEVDQRCRLDVPLHWHRWNLESALLDGLSSSLLEYGLHRLKH